MNIPRHWVRTERTLEVAGARRRIVAWGWSSKDRAEAGRMTEERLEETGSGWTHREVEPIVRLHDETTRASSGLPLA